MRGRAFDTVKFNCLFIQSDQFYCRIPAEDLKYQGTQSFQGRETQNSLCKWIFKKINVSETDAGIGNRGCGSVCIQVVSSDPKICKSTTRSTCMAG